MKGVCQVTRVDINQLIISEHQLRVSAYQNGAVECENIEVVSFILQI